MKKILRILRNTFVITIGTLIALMVVTAVLLNTDRVQNKLLQYLVDKLKDDLRTEVSIEHVNVDVWYQTAWQEQGG